MNRSKQLFMGLFFLSAIPFSLSGGSGFSVKENVFKNNVALRKFCSSYMASLVLGGCVGATTGSLIRYIEKRFNIESSPVGLLLLFLSWTLESEIRNDIIAGIQNDLDAYQIEHKKALMFKSAWVASYLTYFREFLE